MTADPTIEWKTSDVAVNEEPVLATRKDSQRRVESASQRGDLSVSALRETSPPKEKRGKKPGILAIDQVAAGTKMLRKSETIFIVAPSYRNEAGGRPDSTDEQTPFGRLRRKTAHRKGRVLGPSDNEQSGKSWGEIRPHLNRGKEKHSRDKQEKRSPQTRDSIDQPRSSRKRAFIYNSLPDRNSGHPTRRSAGISQPSSSQYPNARSRDSPSRLRQTLPRAKDAPLSPKYDPRCYRNRNTETIWIMWQMFY